MKACVNGMSSLGAVVASMALLATGACAAPSPGVRSDLYACEGCEATAERPAGALTFEADVAQGERGEPLVLRGRVFQADGRTPAPNVVLYLHQTNADGLYANGSTESVWSRRHGRLRGWVKTDAEGRYQFRTIKPAPYPDRTMPAHIHLYVLEPGRRPYYVDDVVFEGEFRVDEAYRAQQELRGGSGIVRLSRGQDGAWLAVRDIRLERHPD